MRDANGSASPDEEARRNLVRSNAEQAALRELVRLIAHDLNNPLQSITLILELLELEVPGEEARERVRQCSKGAALMRHLVRDLAAVARPIRPDEVPTVEATLDQTLGVLRRRLDRHGIELSRDTAAFADRRLASTDEASALRWTLLSALLGTIETAAHAEVERHRLRVTAHGDELRLALEATSDEGPSTASQPATAVWQRVVDACAGSRVSVSADAHGITITLPAQAAG